MKTFICKTFHKKHYEVVERSNSTELVGFVTRNCTKCGRRWTWWWDDHEMLGI